jgi:hypothetical protein
MAEQGEGDAPKKSLSKSTSRGKALSKKKSKEELNKDKIETPTKSPRGDEEKDSLPLTESKSRKGLFSKSKSVKAQAIDQPAAAERYGQFEIMENVTPDYGRLFLVVFM